MTHEQYKAALAQGYTAEQIVAHLRTQGMNDTQIAAVFTPPAAAPNTLAGFYGNSPAPAVAAGSALANAIRNAPNPNNAGMSLTDDDGKFDGDYVVELTQIELAKKTKGDVFRAVFRVEESSNLNVPVGAEREFPLFLWNPPALSEAKGFVQLISDAKTGGLEPWTDDFFASLIDERQAGRGIRAHVSVFTKPQKNNRAKMFTHHRWSIIGAGQSLGITAAPAPLTAAAPPSLAAALPGLPPSVPGGAAYAPGLPPMPGAAAPAGLPPMPGAGGPPPGWPPGVPYSTR